MGDGTPAKRMNIAARRKQRRSSLTPVARRKPQPEPKEDPVAPTSVLIPRTKNSNNKNLRSEATVARRQLLNKMSTRASHPGISNPHGKKGTRKKKTQRNDQGGGDQDAMDTEEEGEGSFFGEGEEEPEWLNQIETPGEDPRARHRKEKQELQTTLREMRLQRENMPKKTLEQREARRALTLEMMEMENNHRLRADKEMMLFFEAPENAEYTAKVREENLEKRRTRKKALKGRDRHGMGHKN
jgi:hypothetical protein